MRIILDTNIWISGLLLPKSQAGLILKEWRDSKFNVILSPYILEEIRRVLAYPKISRRLKWDAHTINHYIELLAFLTEVEEHQDGIATVKRDPKDSPILSLLVTTKADYLITGDEDLLSMQKQYPILDIKQFLEKTGRIV